MILLRTECEQAHMAFFLRKNKEVKTSAPA